MSVAGRGLAPAERGIHLKTYSAAERAIGQTVRVEFGNIPLRDKAGRRGYVVGFILTAGLKYDVSGDGAADVPGRVALAQIEQVRLKVNGGALEVFDGTYDLRALRADMVKRYGDTFTNDPADIVDGVASNTEQEITFVYRFTRTAKGRGRRDGAIPLEMLNHRASPQDVLSFRVASALPTADGAEVTLQDFTKLVVTAIVRYDGPKKVGPIGVLRQFEETKLEVEVPDADENRRCRLDYAIVRHLEEDTNALACSGYGELTLSYDGDPQYDGVDVTYLNNMAAALETDLAVAPPADLAPGDGNSINLASSRIGTAQGDKPRTPIFAKFKSRTQSVTRVLHRQMVTQTPAEVARLMKRWGANPADYARVPKGNFSGHLHPDEVPHTVRRRVGGGRRKPCDCKG